MSEKKSKIGKTIFLVGLMLCIAGVGLLFGEATQTKAYGGLALLFGLVVAGVGRIADWLAN